MLFALFIVLQCISFLQVHGAVCIFKHSPEQMRVAFRGPNAVTISWRTSGDFFQNDTPEPQVAYSTDSKLHNSKVSPVGITENYTKRSWFHNVALLGLQPGTRYYYRILASPDHCVRESGIYSFKTAPVAGNPSPINITILGDLGNDNLINLGAATRTMKVLRAVAPVSDFYIHSGDIAYADDYNLGLPLEFYEQSWNKWQGNMQALTANNVYMTACGNHEVTCFQLGDWACGVTNYRNFTPYLHRFRMPGDESGGYKNLWYSFDYGLVHVVVISTETDFPNAPAGPGTLLNGGNFKGLNGQLDWFEADLIAANANRDQVPWILVTGHRPFYGSLPAIAGIPVPGLCDACLAAFEPYILQYNVDFYFSGHVHWYERLWPIDANGNPLAQNYDNQPGPIHITNGGAGCPEGASKPKETISASAKIVSGYGFTQLEIKDASHATIRYIDTSNSQVVDTADVYRAH